MSTHPIIAEDVKGVLDRTQRLWPDLKNATVFITGATGFFGIWLLETLLAANREFSLGCRVIGVSRFPDRFARKVPHLANDPAVTWITGDVRSFQFPSGPVTHIIHAATESSTNLNVSDPQEMFDVCLDGTRRILSLAREKRVMRLLFTSSGAIYGRQPPELSHIPETFTGAPALLDPRSAYAEGKRAAEFLCGLAAADQMATTAVTIARCFAFVGPYLPLDAHYAIGNFIRDALTGGPIRISGDGTPFRSYLYAAHLAEWLITILLRGRSGRAYNVGSPEATSIRELADHVAKVAGYEHKIAPPRITIALEPQPGCQPERYIPSCRRAFDEFGLVAVTPLSTAIGRTMRFTASTTSQSDRHIQRPQ